MTNIGDFLKDDVINSIASQSVEQGNVYRIELDRSNGVVPKHGDASRNKFFIVLGYDSSGFVYGGLVINSAINKSLNYRLQQLMMPISASQYGFLSHNSFVDCTKIMTVNTGKFLQWKYLGRLNDEDVELAIGTLEDSPLIKNETLKRFNL